MIVTCEACETQFQLDDSKVPDEGIRVRCSRCKHAFHIESPRRPDADRADDLARQALRPERPAVASPAGREGGALDDEADWQFNEEVAPKTPSSERARSAARLAVDDLLGGAAAMPTATPTAPPPEPDLDLAPPTEAGEVDAGDLDDEIPDIEGPAESDGDLTDDPDALVDAAPGEAVASAPAADDVEDFDDLEDDDPFADLEPDAAPGRVPPEADRVAVARIRHELPTEAPAVEGRAKKRGGPDFDRDVDADVSSAWVARVRGGLGWALVTGLVAYAAVQGLWPARPGGAGSLPAHSVGGMIVEEVEGRWIENAVAGPLYVISGWLRADPAQPPEPGLQLRIRLLDSEGAALVSVSSALGPPLRHEQLREWSLPDLRDLHERRALRMAWRRLRAGQRRPFQAVLAEVPPAATAYEFQAFQAAAPTRDESEPPASAFPAGHPTAGITSAPTG